MEEWLGPFLGDKPPRRKKTTLFYDVTDKVTSKVHPVELTVLANTARPCKNANNSNDNGAWFPGCEASRNGEFRIIQVTIPRPPRSECMYMLVAVPLTDKGVCHAWLSTLLYDAGNGIDPSDCPFSDNVPIQNNIGWGTFLLSFVIEVARFCGASWIGLTDGSFVEKCGEDVPFSDYRRTSGKQPFYEQNGFIEMTTDSDRSRLTVASRYSEVRRKIETNHRRYLRDLEKCRKSKSKVCFNCFGQGCPTCGPNTTVNEAGKMLTDLMDNGSPQACKAFDLYTRECMYKFTARHHGSEKDRVKFLTSSGKLRRSRRHAAKDAKRRLTAYYRK